LKTSEQMQQKKSRKAMPRSFPAAAGSLLHMAGALAIAGCLLATLSSCRDDEYFRELRHKEAEKHFSEFKLSPLPAETLTLPFCIETALKKNLDLKVAALQKSIEREKVTAAYLGMLPEMNIEGNVTNRNNDSGGQSINIQTGQQSLTASTSDQRTEYTFKYEIALSSLDFGLAYFNSIAQEDTALIAKTQQQRTAQNLVLNVSKAYFKVAAAQSNLENAEKLMALADKTFTDVSSLERSGAIAPFKAAEDKAAFLRFKQSLMDYRNDYESSCIELCALMNYYPAPNMRVDSSCMNKLADFKLPELECMELSALKSRPELYEANMRTDYSIMEARKSILLMFPNVRAFSDFNASSNKYLYNQSWMELGMRAAYNLFKLPNQIQQYRALDKEIDRTEIKTLALSIGVIAQVRIAHANLMELKRRYEITNSIHQIYSDYIRVANDRLSANGDISPLEVAKLKIQAGDTSIKRSQMMANYYYAYYTLLNSIGVGSIDECKIALPKEADVLASIPEAERKKADESATLAVVPELRSGMQASKEAAKP